jgi:hypothetical protein
MLCFVVAYQDFPANTHFAGLTLNLLVNHVTMITRQGGGDADGPTGCRTNL